jgi:hypothetical protein
MEMHRGSAVNINDFSACAALAQGSGESTEGEAKGIHTCAVIENESAGQVVRMEPQATCQF